MKKIKQGFGWIMALLTFAWWIPMVGCGGEKKDTSEENLSVEARLLKFNSCQEVESHIKATATSDMRRYMGYARRQATDTAYPYYGRSVPFTPTGAAEGGAVSPNAGAPSRNTNQGPTPAHSETNNQEQGVDEADIVKTDGNFIYALANGKLIIFSSIANTAHRALKKISETDLNGSGLEMFVKGDQVVVFLSLWQNAIPEPLKKAIPSPASGAPEPLCPAACTPEHCGCGGIDATQIALIDISDRAAPKLKRTWTGTFGYGSSRLVDDSVRVVLTDAVRGPDYKIWPEVNHSETFGSEAYKKKQLAAIDALERENLKIIAAATLDDMLPEIVQAEFNQDGSKTETTTRIASCESFYRSGLPDGLDILDVATLNLKSTDALQHAAVLGQGGTIYASKENLYVATHPWFSRQWWGWFDNDAAREERTKIHKFDIRTDPNRAIYKATGTVPGYVLNQFSMDDVGDTLRVGTTIDNRFGWADISVSSQGGTPPTVGSVAPNQGGHSGSPGDAPRVNAASGVSMQVERQTLASVCDNRSSNHMFTLQERVVRGKNILAIRSSVRDLACGETIQSMRYVGNTGYMVTFERKDPLYVFDLEDPANIKKLGQLTISGFSTYMHPLDDKHLLTIGRETDAQGGDIGLALSLFDVSDKMNPKLAHRHVIRGYAHSEAEAQHKAFSYFPEQKLLAVPLQKYDWTHRETNWANNEMGLALFNIDVEQGIKPLNMVSHLGTSCYRKPDDKPVPNYVANGWSAYVRRSLMIDKHIYSLSTLALVATPLADYSKIEAAQCLPNPPQFGQRYWLD